VEAQSSQPVRPPSVGPNPIHRTTYVVLGAALLVALAIAAGVAALVAAGNDEQTPTPPTTTVAAAAVRTLAAAEGNVSNSTISVKITAGWKVSSKSKIAIGLTNSGAAGILYFVSGPYKGTSIQLAQAEYAYLSKQGLKSVKLCGKPAAVKVPNGPTGVLLLVCAVIVGQNRQALPIWWFGFIGAARGAAFEVKMLMPASKPLASKFLAKANPVMRTVHWKLFRGV
jgi:hypothetical protein